MSSLVILAAAFNIWNLVTSVVAVACASIAALATIKSSSKSAETTAKSEEAAATWKAMSELLAHERDERESETRRRQDAEDRLHRAEDHAEEKIRDADARIARSQSAFEHQVHRLGAELADLENRLRSCQEEGRAAHAELLIVRSAMRAEVIDAAVETSGVGRDEIERFLGGPDGSSHES